MKGCILIVDDEASARTGLAKLLKQEEYEVLLAENGRDAWDQLQEHPVDLVLTDLKMPEMDGLELTQKLKAEHPHLPVLVVTAFGDIDSAVRAMRAGAADYLTKPVDFDVLSVSLERALEAARLRNEADNLRRHVREAAGEGLDGLIGVSPAMQKIYHTTLKVAPARATVLITGESGTGKGELAKAIHRKSARADKPFVFLHCAALVESLLESELFGHERGAFTSADRRRIGRFELAQGGTLFLDEVGEIPHTTQVKLLRVLQDRAFERVGGNETITADVRLIAATNKDLVAAVEDGSFREDLFYRLNVVHIEMPPLRVRDGDVLLLANFFVRKFAQDNARDVTGFTNAAKAKLTSHRWPGNVRELENAIERAVVMCEGQEVDAEHLPMEVTPVSKGPLRIPGSTMAELERHAILSTLEAVGGSTAKAAEMLDISVRTIQYRLHEYGVTSSSAKAKKSKKG